MAPFASTPRRYPLRLAGLPSVPTADVDSEQSPQALDCLFPELGLYLFRAVSELLTHALMIRSPLGN